MTLGIEELRSYAGLLECYPETDVLLTGAAGEEALSVKDVREIITYAQSLELTLVHIAIEAGALLRAREPDMAWGVAKISYYARSTLDADEDHNGAPLAAPKDAAPQVPIDREAGGSSPATEGERSPAVAAPDGWDLWYAWHPVKVEGKWAWLRYVERVWCPLLGMDFWTYREPKGGGSGIV